METLIYGVKKRPPPPPGRSAPPPGRFQEMFPGSVPKNKRAQEKFLGKGPSCP